MIVRTINLVGLKLRLLGQALHKGRTMAISSINFAKAKSGAMAHNTRIEKKEPGYLLPKELRLENEYNRSKQDADILLHQLYQDAKDRYKQTTGQRLQAKSYQWEAVVNLNSEHTMKDLEDLSRKIEEETGFTALQISIHRDEGRVERGAVIRNLHAHIVFFTLSRENGQQLYRRSLTKNQMKNNPDLKPMNRERLSKLQDIAAESLSMQRGKRGSTAVRKTHKQYKAEQSELARVKDVTLQYKKERERLIESKRALQEDYSLLKRQYENLKKQASEKLLSLSELNSELKAENERLRDSFSPIEAKIPMGRKQLQELENYTSFFQRREEDKRLGTDNYNEQFKREVELQERQFEEFKRVFDVDKVVDVYDTAPQAEERKRDIRNLIFR